MYDYILCYCGRDIGSLCDIFRIMRDQVRARVLEDIEDSVDPAMMGVSEAVQMSLEEVFEQLNLTLPCCLARINTQIVFKSLY